MNTRQKIVIAGIMICASLTACSSTADSQQTFIGIVMTGAQLGEVKNFCAEGMYLVADEGYLIDQTQMLLLKIPNDIDGTKILSDPQYVGKKVEVRGKYPAQEVFCEALTCECEDYILVEKIQITE